MARHRAVHLSASLCVTCISLLVCTASTPHRHPSAWVLPAASAPSSPLRLSIRGGGGTDLADEEQERLLWESAWTQDFADSGLDPLWMQGLTAEEEEMARDELVEGIMHGEDDEAELAEYHKKQGNDYSAHAVRVRAAGGDDAGNYTNLYAHAIRSYSTAIKHSQHRPLVRIQSHANRAVAHLERGNFGYALQDSLRAVNLSGYAAVGHAEGNPLCCCGREGAGVVGECGAGNVSGTEMIVRKSYWRAAVACLRLERWGEAADLCRRGMSVSGLGAEGNARLEGTLAEAEARLEAREREQGRRRAEEEGRRRKMTTLGQATRERGVVVGESMYGDVLRTQGVDIDHDLARGGGLAWPVLVIYDEHRQSDFLRRTSEDSTVRDILEVVLGGGQPPPAWDPRGEYTPESVSVHVITYQAPIIANGKRVWIQDADTGRRCRQEWVRVRKGDTLAEVLLLDGHVVPRCVVLHVAVEGSAFEGHMLGREAQEYVS